MKNEENTGSGEEGIHEEWYASAFGELYPILYAHRTVEAAAPEAQFAIAQVALSSADAILDLCCGNGRHLVHLQEKAPNAVGLDYSPHLLKLAASQCAPNTRLLRADMRAVPFEGCFDVVFNFFTSFGYFQTREENQAVALHMGRALKPAGRFFMDYLNADHVRETLVPFSKRDQGDYHIEDQRWIDEKAKRVNKKTVVSRAGELVLEIGESVRLYTLEDLQDLLHFAGLEIDRVFGDYEGGGCHASRPRMILVGHRSTVDA